MIDVSAWAGPPFFRRELRTFVFHGKFFTGGGLASIRSQGGFHA